MFWRKKKNQAEQEQDRKDEKLLHHQGEPEIELPIEYDSDIEPDQRHEIEGDAQTHVPEMSVSPVPDYTPSELEDDNDSDKGGWFSRLSSGLSKSSGKLGQGISDLFTKKKLDQDTLDGLEDLLITADLGPHTAAKLVQEFSEGRFDKEISEQDVREALATQITAILEPVAKSLPLEGGGPPHVMLVCGVNGVGKTTTIGKLAHWMQFNHGKKVMLAAGDTFRAAAVEQLQVWGERAHVPVLAKDIGADSAAVAYEAYEKAKTEGRDILMIDTAGRLHNKANLMAELEKIVRVLKKQDETAPHECLLVLDATTGQNAHAQVEAFRELVNVTGLIVTKLDGSAKGGVVVSLADQFKLPIYAIGVGEGMEDLQDFHPAEYAAALMGIEKT